MSFAGNYLQVSSDKQSPGLPADACSICGTRPKHTDAFIRSCTFALAVVRGQERDSKVAALVHILNGGLNVRRQLLSVLWASWTVHARYRRLNCSCLNGLWLLGWPEGVCDFHKHRLDGGQAFATTR